MPRNRLEAVLARDGDLVIERDRERPSGRLLRQNGMEASYVDLANPRHLEFDYLRWIRLTLRAAGARRVLHVGGAGCTLARALALEDRASRQDVCELDARVIAFARRHLGLRRMPGLRVRCAEGRCFIATQPDRSRDAIVIDAFIGAAVPRHLITAEAMRDLARVAPLAIVNVVDERAGTDVRLIAAGLAVAYPAVWALRGRVGNTVLAGALRPPDLERLAAAAAADRSPARLQGPQQLGLATAGAIALTDAELGVDLRHLASGESMTPAPKLTDPARDARREPRRPQTPARW